MNSSVKKHMLLHVADLQAKTQCPSAEVVHHVTFMTSQIHEKTYCVISIYTDYCLKKLRKCFASCAN